MQEARRANLLGVKAQQILLKRSPLLQTQAGNAPSNLNITGV
jgi:hypothetical protein